MTPIDLPCGTQLDFSGPPLVMAVVNCTDDSFYAGSRNKTIDDALRRAFKAEQDGAALIDFGAESTRPGAAYISAEEEKCRLLPVIENFRKQSSLPVSVDTRKSEIASLVLDAGADVINDISALEDSPEIAQICAKHNAAIILMHKKGVPSDMQNKPYYNNVVHEVMNYLVGAAKRAEAGGISPHRIILDPGIGFGKRTQDNLDLISHFDIIAALGYPTLMALSRKTFIGDVTGRDVPERLAGTIAANAYSLFMGAHIIRVHDVQEAVDLVKIFHAISERK